jgi:hypothetical protein
MKKLLIIAFLLVSTFASAQFTLTEKSNLAYNPIFRNRVYQALFSKANVYTGQTPQNLAWQKQVLYARIFTTKQLSTDLEVITRFWLSNYNGVPVLDGNGQPTDNEILNSNALDIVYNALSGVNPGDDQLPIQ